MRACSVSEIPKEGAILRVLDGIPVCLARSGNEIFAINDVCSHADVSLSEGEVEDGHIECWLHGSTFDLRTGKPTALPATKPVATYPVTIEGDDVFIQLEN
jgi:3-phenylpropionate/trans-cinnamate dioxygenase ferredoxin subunit